MKTVAILLACLMLASCAVLNPREKREAIDRLQIAYEAGDITAAQRDAAVEAIQSDGDFDWGTLGLVGMNILLAFVGGPMVVRYQRGRPTQKVGLPEDKVIRQ